MKCVRALNIFTQGLQKYLFIILHKGAPRQLRGRTCNDDKMTNKGPPAPRHSQHCFEVNKMKWSAFVCLSWSLCNAKGVFIFA
jgi:hypothetical protein